MRPRAILVTGAPGSGKSTLARSLAEALRVPSIARDQVRGGLLFTAGAWNESLERVPTSDEAVEQFLQTVERLLQAGVSCVVEFMVRSHRMADLDRILAAGDCVVLTTRCAGAIDRFTERNRRDLLISQRAILEATGFDSVDDHTADAIGRMRTAETEMLTEFPVPVLDVDTTDGYRPPLSTIIEFVTRPLPAER